MTRVADRCGAINLAQGFPDFPAPEVLKEAAVRAIRDEVNQYAVTWGAPRLREAVAASYERWYGFVVDPDRHVTITCGATEAMVAVMLALVDPGDEVIILEPFYENYGPDAILCDAKPVFVPVRPGEGIDLDRLARAFSPATRAIVLNTPNNPTGHVLTRSELEVIGALCQRHDAWAITDEIYEHILFEGEHLPMARMPGMRDRTVTVSGASKTFSVTGWRVGTVVAPEAASDAIRKVHDFLTVGAPAPLQEAVAVAMETLGDDFYQDLATGYRTRRDLLVSSLLGAGFRCRPPAGAYYILADFSELSREDDTTFALRLAKETGVAPVPGSSFFSDPADGRHLVRFAFCKSENLLLEASRRITNSFSG
jgi:aminotransferase